MRLSKLVSVLDGIAPNRYAEGWDNIGLLAGDGSQEISQCLLTIDLTPEVLEEAKQMGCEMVIAYHPPLFHAVKRLGAGDVVFDAIRAGVAVYSPHTALDVAAGGTNDVLADILGLTERLALRAVDEKSRLYKLVTFIPTKDLEKVSSAMFDAGAGGIGNYSKCSFRTSGIGSFEPGPLANPAIGERNEYEEVEEVRFELICRVDRLQDVLAALRGAHPYEEPAIDVFQLVAAPGKLGQGRIGDLPETSLTDLLERLRVGLNVGHLLVCAAAGEAVEDIRIRRAAVLAGAGRGHIDDALRLGAQLLVTGEIPHHDALRASQAGLTVVATLHSNSERAALKPFAERLAAAAAGVAFRLSQIDRDPFLIV